MIQLYRAFDEQFENKIIFAFEKNNLNHVPSGKLSAGQLSKPLLWQMLKYLEVPSPIDSYLSLKFKRGHDVEEAFLKEIDGIVDKQRKIEFKGTVGLIDAIVETREWGQLPLEVKSVTSMKYRRIIKEGKPDDHYQLQATLYALAEKKDKYLISIVNADDFRPLTFLCDTFDYEAEVNIIIDRYNNALKTRTMPKFEARYNWQNNTDYQDYIEFNSLSPSQILEKLKVDYPKSYEKWQKGS